MVDGHLLPERDEQIVSMLKDETWCTSYMFLLRWPEGFICPTCGWHDAKSKPLKHPVCRNCGRIYSITAGTLMHGSKKLLSDWLQAIWWLCCRPDASSIKDLQNILALNSYQTAWTWMQKLRLAMQMTNRQKCAGTVEIDHFRKKLRKSDTGCCYLLAAVEIQPADWSTCRVRMSACSTISAPVIECFISNYIQTGSTLIAPDREPFQSFSSLEYLYTVEKGRQFQENVQDLCARFYDWYRKRQFQATTSMRLQNCLDEFVFHTNSRLLPNKRVVFEQLLTSILHHNPAPYRELVPRSLISGGAA